MKKQVKRNSNNIIKEKEQVIQRRDNTNGITLVALVVTIVVLLILSGITINILLNSGVINIAQETKEEQRKAEILEQLQIVEQDIVTKNLGNITIEEYLEQIYSKRIVVPEKTEQVDEKSYNVTSEDGYTFHIKEERKNVIKINYIEKIDKTPEKPIEKFSINEEFQYTGSEQQVTLKPGTYEIKCYGAEGGYGKYDDTYKYAPGKGAYTKGILTLTETTTLYLYVGGKGGDSPKGNKAAGGTGGYNGGGTGGRDSSDNDSGGGGGGATDIRLIGGEWNNADGLRSRIMVAAGGSGSGYVAAGQDGGTLEGNSYDTSKKATQTSGNAFGIGENGTDNTYVAGSGGGGGYYGGFGDTCSSSTTDKRTVGGSGSSYISGYTGCNSVKSQTDGTHSGSSIHYSNLKFDKAFMLSGYNEGNGKITIEGGTEYIPTESTWIDNTYNYTGEEQKVLLEPGTYEIECYGAEGGYGKYNDTYKYAPGKGAYTRGILTLTKTTTLYLYVGGKGGDSPKGNGAAGGTGGYNGGGTGGRDSSDNDSGGGGGGATDIRLIGGEWNNADGLRSRIMVAAGGSGSSYVTEGLDGGELEGNTYDTKNNTTQTSGNAFGIGGNGTDYTSVAGSGAGGGYYGGIGGEQGGTSNKKTVGESGSSYISGYNGCNSVKSQTSSTHSGSSTHYSNLIFKNAIMTAGTNAGDGKIVIKGGKDYVPSVKNEPTIINQTYSYTGGTQQVTLNPGTYVIECYGAEGGYGKNDDSYKYAPGKGAVTKGELTLTETTTLYLYVGGKGGDSPKGNKAAGGIGGYNGGGTGGRDSSDNDSGGGGGGATDIRLIGGEWNNASGLRSRIMVAAGGSGSSYAAAGLNGGTLEGNTNDTSKKATQTSGDAFGIGGNGTDSTFIGGSGAGGGYYGGFGGASTSSITDNKTVGGSGSSYISGYTGCNSVKSQTSSTHSGSSTHYSNLIFKNATMTAGTNSGNGKIVIRNK